MQLKTSYRKVWQADHRNHRRAVKSALRYKMAKDAGFDSIRSAPKGYQP